MSSCSEIIDPEGVLHLHTASAFLVRGTEATLLLDVGAPFFARMESVIADLLAGRKLDWIFPIHLEQAHAGGLPQIANRFAEAQIVADARDYEYYFPELAPRVTNVRPGNELELAAGTASSSSRLW